METANNAKESNKKDKNIFARHKQLTALLGTCLLMGLLNLLSWQSRGFCDLYREHIFPLWGQTCGRLTSILPFSFGELLIAIAVFGIPLSLIAMAVLIIAMKGRRAKVARIFGFIYGWILCFILTTETLNCFILYHCSTLGEISGIPTTQHTDEDLEKLGYWVIGNINSLAPQVTRDENNCFVLTADLNETPRQAMEALGEEFPLLSGRYNRPKEIYCSFFMSQMDLMGIYFPFSLEANYNGEMYKAKVPCTVCHELSHTKGFMTEDEANFLSFLACQRCDNVEYQYSGYLSALTYIRNKYFESATQEQKQQFDSAIDPLVWTDIDQNRQFWQRVSEAEDTVFKSESVSRVSDKAMETSLHMNGVKDGKKSYGRMVDLMLDYFLDRIDADEI